MLCVLVQWYLWCYTQKKTHCTYSSLHNCFYICIILIIWRGQHQLFETWGNNQENHNLLLSRYSSLQIKCFENPTSSPTGTSENLMIPTLLRCIEGMPSCLPGLQLLSVSCIREINFGSLDVRSNLDLKEHSLLFRSHCNYASNNLTIITINIAIASVWSQLHLFLIDFTLLRIIFTLLRVGFDFLLL